MNHELLQRIGPVAVFVEFTDSLDYICGGRDGVGQLLFGVSVDLAGEISLQALNEMESPRLATLLVFSTLTYLQREISREGN